MTLTWPVAAAVLLGALLHAGWNALVKSSTDKALDTAAIAAFGPFFFGIGLTLMTATIFYVIGIAFAVMCVAITWVRYARPGAPKPS